jgi:hypothetical protein
MKNMAHTISRKRRRKIIQSLVKKKNTTLEKTGNHITRHPIPNTPNHLLRRLKLLSFVLHMNKYLPPSPLTQHRPATLSSPTYNSQNSKCRRMPKYYPPCETHTHGQQSGTQVPLLWGNQRPASSGTLPPYHIPKHIHHHDNATSCTPGFKTTSFPPDLQIFWALFQGFLYAYSFRSKLHLSVTQHGEHNVKSI